MSSCALSSCLVLSLQRQVSELKARIAVLENQAGGSVKEGQDEPVKETATVPAEDMGSLMAGFIDDNRGERQDGGQSLNPDYVDLLENGGFGVPQELSGNPDLTALLQSQFMDAGFPPSNRL